MIVTEFIQEYLKKTRRLFSIVNAEHYFMCKKKINELNIIPIELTLEYNINMFMKEINYKKHIKRNVSLSEARNIIKKSKNNRHHLEYCNIGPFVHSLKEILFEMSAAEFSSKLLYSKNEKYNDCQCWDCLSSPISSFRAADPVKFRLPPIYEFEK